MRGRPSSPVRRRSRPFRTSSRLFALASLAAVAAAAPAHAATWKRVAGVPAPARSTSDVGLARTPDGRLHVLYARDGGVFQRALGGAERPVASFGSVNPSVALVAGTGGMRAFFAGLAEGGPADRVLSTSVSADGSSWSAPAPVSGSGSPFAASGIAGALGIDGTPLAVWGSAGEGFHVGLDPAAGDGDLAGSVSGPGAAVDAVTGQPVLAWERPGPGRIVAQSLFPPGPPVVVPGSEASQALHRVGVTGRIGAPGIWVAYTAGANEFTGRAAVWRFGSTAGTPVSAPGARHATIAAAPGGRLWVLWDADGRVYARRSDRDAEAFGRLVSVAAPRRTRTVHDLAGEGSRGPLDVLALAERRGGSAWWSARLLPGLTLRARARGERVTFTVADAGEPVRGALVRVDGKRSRTDRRGRARAIVKPGRRRATAARRGYSPASARVRVE